MDEKEGGGGVGEGGIGGYKTSMLLGDEEGVGRAMRVANIAFSVAKVPETAVRLRLGVGVRSIPRLTVVQEVDRITQTIVSINPEENK